MSDLVNRKRYSTSINTDILNKFKKLSDITRISQSKLMDEALEDLIKKYDTQKED